MGEFEIGRGWDGRVWYSRDGRVTEIVETFADHIHVPVPRVEVTGAMEGPLQQSVVHHLIGLLRMKKVDMKFMNLVIFINVLVSNCRL